MQESFHDGSRPTSASFASDGGGQVMMTAVKQHEEGDDLVVRAVEVSGRPGPAVLDLPVAGVRLETDFGASQIRTFRISRPADAGGQVDVVEVDLIEDDLAAPTAPIAVTLLDV
jgi:alpha-mannosidase